MCALLNASARGQPMLFRQPHPPGKGVMRATMEPLNMFYPVKSFNYGQHSLKINGLQACCEKSPKQAF